jgi:hypothetical protein
MSAASVPRLWSLVFDAIRSGASGGPSVAVVGVVFLGFPVVGTGLSGVAGAGMAGIRVNVVVVWSAPGARSVGCVVGGGVGLG